MFGSGEQKRVRITEADSFYSVLLLCVLFEGVEELLDGLFGGRFHLAVDGGQIFLDGLL